MIIFVEDTNLLELTALFNNETNSLDLNNKPNVVFNLSSTSNMGVRLNIVPPYTIDVFDERQFDIIYANYLLSNNDAFISYMQTVYNSYLGFNVFILVGTDSFGGRERITESFMKFLQQRYNIIPRYVQSINDIPDYYEEEPIYVDGLFNLDQDKERFIYLTASVPQLEEEMSKYE